MDVVLQKYPDKSHNFRNLNFYDVITLELYWSSRLHLKLYTILIYSQILLRFLMTTAFVLSKLLVLLIVSQSSSHFLNKYTYIPGFLKTGLVKISTHSTTWQFKTTKLIQRPIKSLYLTPDSTLVVPRSIPTSPTLPLRLRLK